jgi:hypothetical protein
MSNANTTNEVATKSSKRRGRPHSFNNKVRRHIASLVRKTNATVAHAILTAPADSELGQQRNLNIVPDALDISYPTVVGYANAAGVELKRGRPSVAA